MNNTVENERKQTPHRSTTHDERFFHIHEGAYDDKRDYIGGTVFFRRESDGNWYFSVARCDWRDRFVKRRGRQTARRKYFNARQKGIRQRLFDEPSFEHASDIYKSVMVD